jgi:cytidyltransferase-like protein
VINNTFYAFGHVVDIGLLRKIRVKNRMSKLSVFLKKYKGRVLVNSEDNCVKMILAWLFLLDVNKYIYVTGTVDYDARGIWSRTKRIKMTIDKDLLIVSDDKYRISGIEGITINIFDEIKEQQVLIDELTENIDREIGEAYTCISYYTEEYQKKVSYLPDMYYLNNQLVNADYKSEYVNIIDSIRYTNEQYINGDRDVTIHFFGDSRFYGLYVEDDYTLASIVSKLTKYRCMNYGVHGTSIYDLRLQIKSANIHKNDIVVINNGFIKSSEKYAPSIVDEAVCHEIVEIKEMCDLLQAHLIVCILPDCGDKAVISENEWRFCLYDELQKIGDANSKYYSLDATWEKVRVDLQQKGIICCDIAATLRYYMGREIFIDYIHFGPAGNQLIAAELAGYINEIEHPKTNRIEKIESVKENYEKIICERRGDLNSNFFDNDKFQSFISMLRKNAADKFGKGAVIVMNANPFTKGHLYILEQALKLVDYLFVLVVQESETVIPFEDRLMLVQQNTELLENLIIIPSSEYVVSTVTLPEYFKKEKNQLLSVDASRDIRIFTEFVMPALNVRMRIAGEEPYCRVTREYNRQIKERFEHENLEFVLIERLKADGEFISASRVRKALKDNDLDKIRELVPDATYNYLVNSREMLIERINRLEVGRE